MGVDTDVNRDGLLDGHPRDWNYQIFVRGCGGVNVKVWDYEAPQDEEFILHETQVDPRETKDPEDVAGQIRLAFRRIADMHADHLYELKQATR